MPRAVQPREGDRVRTGAPSLLPVRAMIAVAKADGQIDTQESQVIVNRINGIDLRADEKALLFRGVRPVAGHRCAGM